MLLKALSKAQSALEDTLITQIRLNPNLSQAELADILGVSRRIIQKLMNELKNSGRIQRVGGKRFGHWEIVDQSRFIKYVKPPHFQGGFFVRLL